MARVKRGVTTRARHKKVLARTSGYRGTKSKLFKVAHESLLHAGAYAYAGRKLRKRNARTSWITSISGALEIYNLPYRSFIKGLKDAHIALNRKMLAELAVDQPEAFKQLVEKVWGLKQSPPSDGATA